MGIRWYVCFCVLVVSTVMNAQTSAGQIKGILDAPIWSPDELAGHLRQYLMTRVPPPPSASSPAEWSAQSARLRRHLLDDIAFHGWPKQWVDAPLRFVEVETVETGQGYRLRKLRYEIVPGFWTVGILYEPERLSGKVPAVLDFTGHESEGKSVEFKQKLCIQLARHGLLALNMEWLSLGELRGSEPGNSHRLSAHLDLTGANLLGLFYLAMRKGLDYLYEHPHADQARLAVTGLSGGGWQTIMLSALDERVALAIPVAGYSALVSRIEFVEGDLEHSASDFFVGQDYPHLTAMRAPRPTLLIYNAEDRCCYRAPLVKPYIYDHVKPIFRLFGREDAFAWHENTDPSDHNYQLDNRTQAYRFISRHFGLPPMDDEKGVAPQIKSHEELVVGLPKDNLTILGLAKRFAAEIRRPPVPATGPARRAWAVAQRERLSNIVRFNRVEVKHPWAKTNTKNKGLETRSYRLEFSDGLGASVVWLKAIASPDDAPTTIVLNDKGKKEASGQVSDRLNRGEQVLALDLLFHGDSAPPRQLRFTQWLSGTGVRPLGIQAAQLIAAARWLQKASGAPTIRLDTTGIRTQVAAATARALQPDLFSELVVHQGMSSFQQLFDQPVPYEDAPDLFCLDLYKEFDLDLLSILAEK